MSEEKPSLPEAASPAPAAAPPVMPPPMGHPAVAPQPPPPYLAPRPIMASQVGGKSIYTANVIICNQLNI